ncbi:hypothetical protein FA95DRAFT_890094 [Auriscalpium vulgare]|uniref:Uncharacterized protein n=1 Tax=Auriscalpium vulgare TaxID=40419 RepID=A0ACB8S0H6_9AGAM|nr:hypothetical protein FA95DRAFT_890094 [Auriscalpium vulgare]
MDIGPNFGALVVGMMLNLILYGFMFVQCFVYLTTYKRDAIWIKVFVAFLFLADSVDAGFTAATLYDYLVTHFDYLQTATWLFDTDPALTGIISCSVQLFFAYRVKRLTGYSWIAVIISLLAVGSLCGALGSAIAVNWWHEFVQFQHFKVVVVIWLVCAAVADIMITFVLVFYLKKKRTGFVATDDIINKIVRLTVQTGLLTALVATIDVILFLASTSPTHLLFNLPLSKLYTNSLMSNLNARGGWETSGTQMMSSDGNHPSVNVQRRAPGAKNVVVISKDVTSMTDATYATNAYVGPYDGQHEMDVMKGYEAPLTSEIPIHAV